MKDNESVSPEASEKELDAVKDIFRTLTKTQKTFTVYPKDNPIYQKFAAELCDKLTLFFESSDELSLDVQQYSLLFKGNEVFWQRGEDGQYGPPAFCRRHTADKFPEGLK